MVVNFRFIKCFSLVRGFVSQTICLRIYYYYNDLLFRGNEHKLSVVYFYKSDLYFVETFFNRNKNTKKEFRKKPLE